MVSLAFGKPTIVSPVGGIAEFIKDRENGILSQGGNVAELASNINKLLQDRTLQEELSKNALETNKNFKWENIAEEIYQVYKGVLR